LSLAVVCGGCAEATIAGVGAVAGLAATGVSTGADVYRMGKLDAVDMISLDDQIAAVQSAARDLRLTLQKQELYNTDHGRWRCTISDDRDTRFRVYLERRTARLCRSRIDVGIFGSESTARLFLARMRAKSAKSRPTTAIVTITTTTAPAPP
jgi:hypothetical protein